MNKFIIICIIFIVIILSKINSIYEDKLEHLTVQSDEAIQNLASLYNKDQFSIGKIRLGDKWILSGVGDNEVNDDVFRVYKADGTLAKMKSGPFTSSEIIDMSMQGPIKKYVDTKDIEIKDNVTKELTTTTGNIQNYVSNEVNTMNTRIKAIDDKIKSQDLSSVYQNGQVTAEKVLIGNKYLVIGGNDGILRIHKADGSGLSGMELGQFTGAQIFDKTMNGSIKGYVDNGLNSQFTTLSSTIDKRFSDAGNQITSLNTSTDKRFNDIGGQITLINTNTDKKFSDINNKLTELNNAIAKVDGRVTETNTNYVTEVKRLDGRITDVNNAYINEAKRLDSRITDVNNAYINEAKRLDGRINDVNNNMIKKNTPFRMRTNSNWIAQHNNGGYGPYLYAGNHDQALWRQPWAHPDHSPDRHSFTIEQ